MGKFPESADALDDDFEYDADLVASDAEDEVTASQPVAGPSKKRAIQAIPDEEDSFALDEQDGPESDAEAQQESEQEEDEYGLPVNRAVKNETERAAARAIQSAATSSREDKKRKRKEKTKEAKVRQAKFFNCPRLKFAPAPAQKDEKYG